MSEAVSAEDWIKGISLSILASIIGGASKLSIRKSWIIQQQAQDEEDTIISLPRMANTESRHSDSGRSNENSEIYDEADAIYNTDVTPPPPHAPRSLRRAYLLRLGGMMGMTFFNPLCSVLAMNYASPSILAPFAGLTLVWIVLFSPIVIGEIPSRNQLLGALLIILGEVVVAVFGDHKNDEDVTFDRIRQSYRNSAFHAYFTILALWMGLLFYFMKRPPSPLIKKFAWGVSGGSVTGLQNFLKDALTILKHHKGSFLTVPWLFFLFMGLAITSAFGGLLLLTACMKRYDATYSSASFVGSFVVSASIMACIHYSTFSNLTSIVSYILYPAGLVILIVGVLFLLRDTHAYRSLDHEESSESEEDGGHGYQSMEDGIAEGAPEIS